MASTSEAKIKEKILKRRRSMFTDLEESAQTDPDIPKFVLNTAYFEKWNEQFRSGLISVLKASTLTTGKYIQEQGKPFEDVFFLIEGTALCIAYPRYHKTEYPELYRPIPLSAEDQAIFSALDYDRFRYMAVPSIKCDGGNPDKRHSVMQCHRLHHMSKLPALKRIKGYTAAEGYEFNRRQEICVVGKGEIIGDVEVLLGLPVSVLSFVCTSDCKLLSLNVSAFEKTFRKNERTMESIRMTAEMKLLQRLRSVPGFQCPLMASLIQQLADMAPDKKTRTSKRNLLVGKKPDEDEKSLINRVVQEMTPGHWKRAPDMTENQKDELDEALQRMVKDNIKHYRTLKKTKVIKLDDKMWS